jgi:hypothetical protein
MFIGRMSLSGPRGQCGGGLDLVPKIGGAADAD